MFELREISLVYDLGKEEVTHALRDINLQLDRTGVTGIIGPSGSGKSSLLYMMAGLKSPTSGEVLYNGACISTMSVDQRARLRLKDFGFIFQRGFLIDYLNVLDNVLVPVNAAPAKHKAQAMELLERLGVGKLAGKLPYQLSGGQRQRVAIARALINNPRVVFADEPTAALDHNSARETMKLLAEYSKEKLVIVVTHDTSILDDGSPRITLWDGQVNQPALNWEPDFTTRQAGAR